MDVKNKRHFPGVLIAVEGLDGSGKSTQLYLVKRWLEINGYHVYLTEWNSSDMVRQAIKRGKKKNLLTPTTFSLVHAVDFSDRYHRQIQPLLKTGFIALADRYIFTAFARDAVRGCSPAWLRNLYSFAIVPDITFYFKLPSGAAIERILSNRPKIKYYEAGMDLNLHPEVYDSFRIYQTRIGAEYDRMSAEFGFTEIDATQPIEVQQETIRKIITNRIDLSSFKNGVVL
ncbi:MAG: thymidylate kinase [Candidatus Neomarinimicrobiota bacterium]